MPSKNEIITARFPKNSTEYQLFQQIKEKLQEQRGESISQTQVMRYVLRHFAKIFSQKNLSFLIGCI
jgi:predicted component of type VI protein secretion system